MGSTALFLLRQLCQIRIFTWIHIYTCFSAKCIINQLGVILFIVYFLKIGSVVAYFTIHGNCD